MLRTAPGRSQTVCHHHSYPRTQDDDDRLWRGPPLKITVATSGVVPGFFLVDKRQKPDSSNILNGMWAVEDSLEFLRINVMIPGNRDVR